MQPAPTQTNQRKHYQKGPFYVPANNSHCLRELMQKAQLRTFEQAQSLSLSLVAFTSILALSCALFPHFSYAAQNKSTPNTYTKASLSNDAKPYWTWDDATKTLNFYYGEMPAGATEISLDKYVSPSGTVQGRSWNNHQDDCQHVVIDPSFKDLPSVPYLDYWFYEMSTLEDVTGLQHLHGITSLTWTSLHSQLLQLLLLPTCVMEIRS